LLGAVRQRCEPRRNRLETFLLIDVVDGHPEFGSLLGDDAVEPFPQRHPGTTRRGLGGVPHVEIDAFDVPGNRPRHSVAWLCSGPLLESPTLAEVENHLRYPATMTDFPGRMVNNRLRTVREHKLTKQPDRSRRIFAANR
jgi:hypothetical protein